MRRSNDGVHETLVIPNLQGNTIGTILYHLALIETDWLYSEILEERIPTS